jgi:hypothetical protein
MEWMVWQLVKKDFTLTIVGDGALIFDDATIFDSAAIPPHSI